MDIFTLAANSQYRHSRQVAKISELLAKRLGYSPAEVSVITQAATLHDVGKVDIPPEILSKSGVLSPGEYELVKAHAAAGCRHIEETIRALRVAAIVCKEHHERIGGKCGYLGLSDADIHSYSKLVAVVDVFDALYSKRAYKAPWNIQDICRYFNDQAGLLFDSSIVALLLLSLIPDILRLY